MNSLSSQLSSEEWQKISFMHCCLLTRNSCTPVCVCELSCLWFTWSDIFPCQWCHSSKKMYPALFRLTILQVTGSWARAWELAETISLRYYKAGCSDTTTENENNIWRLYSPSPSSFLTPRPTVCLFSVCVHINVSKSSARQIGLVSSIMWMSSGCEVD